MKNIILKLSIIFVLSLFTQIGYSQNKKPNIVIILADDLGYGSTGAYGVSKDILTTTAIDKLAKEGRKFTRAYTPSSVCSPTRYALLTGQYQWHEGPKYGVLGVRDALCIDTDRETIASRLKDLGYNTASIGKWHLGYQSAKPTNYTKKLSPGPLDVGFDYHWGIPSNNGDRTGIWVENEHTFGLVSKISDLPKDQRPPLVNEKGKKMIGIPAIYRVNEKTADVLDSKINSWIDSQTKDKPFFLYYPMPAIHTPLTPGKNFVGKSNIGLYGDFIMELDHSVSTVMNALKRNGFEDNTIVIFTSDNGGHPSTKGVKEHKFKINGDYRGNKLSVFEGGFIVPFIVKWPEKIEAGSESDELINLVDIYATIMDIVNLKLDSPKLEAGDSHSFYPALFGKPKKPIRDNMIYTSYEGIVSIQVDGWKYIEGKLLDPKLSFMKGIDNPRRLAEAHEQLYNLNVDPYETKDVLKDNMPKVNEIKEILNDIRAKKYSR